MTRVDARTGVEVIEHAECLRLLAGEVVGRVAIVEGTGPLVLPVNYGVHGDQVVFRTGPGSKLAGSHGRQACFEIDGFDRATRSGWSVVLRGRLEEVTSYDPSLGEVEHLADPWLGPGLPTVLRLRPTIVTGRRIPASATGGAGHPEG